MPNADELTSSVYDIYSISKGEGRDGFWFRIGHMIPHEDGQGFNVLLQALPLDRKLVCRRRSNDHDA
jgi:hypothetical protein